MLSMTSGQFLTGLLKLGFDFSVSLLKNAQALLLVLHADPFQTPICLCTLYNGALKNVNEEDLVTDIFSIKCHILIYQPLKISYSCFVNGFAV